MKQLIYLILNTLTLAAVLIINYMSGTGAISEPSVGDISARYSTLFAPAGYAFGIWGLIYLLLIAFVTFQWFVWLKRKDDAELKRTGLWFTLSNLLNVLWIYFWLNENLGLSVIIISLLLIVLIILMFRLRLETWNAPLRIIAFVWWPICIYLGWIIVATVANYAAFFVSLGWNTGGVSETAWTIIMTAIATIIYILLIYFRNMREAALVGIWALIAIAVKNWHSNELIAWPAVGASTVLFLYVMIHGYKNKDTSPFVKLKQR